MGAQQSKRVRRITKDRKFAARQGGWNKRVIDRPSCPTPAKRRFNTRDAALANALTGPRRAYRCACGDWHLTTKRVRQPA